jgi:hypothetical protein
MVADHLYEVDAFGLPLSTALGGRPDAYLDRETGTFIGYPWAKSEPASAGPPVQAPARGSTPQAPAVAAQPVPKRPISSMLYVPCSIGGPPLPPSGPPQPELIVSPPSLARLADEVWAARSPAGND